MRSLETKLTQIGNSRGLRLPAELIRRHRLENGVILEEHENHVLLRGTKGTGRLSWEETAKQMVQAGEDWKEWESTDSDGLEYSPWEEIKPSNEKRPAGRKPTGAR